jgi:hypothetical protein
MYYHDGLVEKLRDNELNQVNPRVVLTECTLGPTWNQAGHPGRVDVLSIGIIWTSFDSRIFECKASVNDFRSDAKEGKWEKYLPYCSRFYFACVQGLLAKKDIPDGAGLIVFDQKKEVWRYIKHPNHRKVEPNPKMLLAALFRMRNPMDPIYGRVQSIMKRWVEVKQYGKRWPLHVKSIMGQDMAERNEDMARRERKLDDREKALDERVKLGLSVLSMLGTQDKYSAEREIHRYLRWRDGNPTQFDGSMGMLEKIRRNSLTIARDAEEMIAMCNQIAQEDT